MVLAARVLIRAYRDLSASVSASYFESFRRVERVPGDAVARLAAPLVEERVLARLGAVGLEAVAEALRAGRQPEQAREAALVRSSGEVSRFVLEGGRETILRSVDEDPEALGYGRVTDGDPCAFCAMLAGRGPVYKSRGTADFEAHGECGCTAEPVYKGSRWPGRAHEFRDMYEEAILEARERDELERGTQNDLLNAFRRYYDSRRPSVRPPRAPAI